MSRPRYPHKSFLGHSFEELDSVKCYITKRDKQLFLFCFDMTQFIDNHPTNPEAEEIVEFAIKQELMPAGYLQEGGLNPALRRKWDLDYLTFEYCWKGSDSNERRDIQDYFREVAENTDWASVEGSEKKRPHTASEKKNMVRMLRALIIEACKREK